MPLLKVNNRNNDSDGPVEIAEGVYWVGGSGEQGGLRCNSYLIVEGEEAMVIDAGSRADFPSVMLKILQCSVTPSSLKTYVFHHYTPDTCGSISNFEDIIGRSDLKIISDKANHPFISHYSVSSKLLTLEEVNNQFTFSSGRKIIFIKTPYAHSRGSFISFDQQTGVLFTSDLFGDDSTRWELFAALSPECSLCENPDNCPVTDPKCPLPGILEYHKRIIPSLKALKYALEEITKIPFSIIAPQHGGIIRKPDDILLIFKKLSAMKEVGVDTIVKDKVGSGDIDLVPLLKRLKQHEN